MCIKFLLYQDWRNRKENSIAQRAQSLGSRTVGDYRKPQDCIFPGAACACSLTVVTRISAHKLLLKLRECAHHSHCLSG